MNRLTRLFFLCTISSFLVVNSAPAAVQTLQSTAIPSAPNEKFNHRINDSKDSNEIDNIVSDALEMFNVPGLALAIVIDNQVVLAKGYGYRNVEENLPVTTDTLFPIASCTKAFTALALGQLVDEGKISWDDPVQKYIPEFSLLDQDVAAQITIRDLLAHRTGMARHDAIWVLSEVPARSSVINILKHLEPACGLHQEFQYNNFMYALAGIVIEKITKKSWEDTISTRLLASLKMKNSNMSIRQLKMSADYSLPYAEINGAIKKIAYRDFPALNPAGGINSNIADMTKWVKLHLSYSNALSNNIIQKQTLNEMHAIQMPISSSSNDGIYRSGYGLGWIIGKYRGHQWISHGGCVDGFASEVSLLPDQKIGLVMLSNSSSDGNEAISSIRNQIFDQLLGLHNPDTGKKALTIRHKVKKALQEALKTFNEMSQTQPSLSLDGYVGYYEHPAYGQMEIKIENDLLLANYGKLAIPLYLKSEDLFLGMGESFELLCYGVNPSVDFRFIQSPSGDINEIQVAFEKFRGAKPVTFMRK